MAARDRSIVLAAAVPRSFRGSLVAVSFSSGLTGEVAVQDQGRWGRARIETVFYGARGGDLHGFERFGADLGDDTGHQEAA